MENFDVQMLPLNNPHDNDPCQNLVLVETTEDNAPNNYQNNYYNAPKRCELSIPVPFFDSISQPSAIALPTKTCPLYNVEANSSAYVLMKFFSKAYTCMQSRAAGPASMERFQGDFCGWIESQVMPRLDDEKFYSAFGGVLRIRHTLKRIGIYIIISFF